MLKLAIRFINIFLSYCSKSFVVVKSFYYTRLFGYCASNVRFFGVDRLLGSNKISIGVNTGFDKHLFLTVWNVDSVSNEDFIIKIGDGCSFGAYNHITASNKVVIGNNCLTGKWVTISDNNHGNTDLVDLKIVPKYRQIISKGPVLIEDNVWIGDKVTILSGVTIGEGAIIAANAVVTKNVPPYSVVAGNPSRILKTYKYE